MANLQDSDFDALSQFSSQDKQLDYLSKKYPNMSFDVDDDGVSVGGTYLPPPAKPDWGELSGMTVDVDPDWVDAGSKMAASDTNPYYSPEAIKARQAPFEDQIKVIPTIQSLRDATPVGAEALPYIGAIAATAAMPASAPWWATSMLAPAVGAGVGSMGESKLTKGEVDYPEAIKEGAITGAGGLLLKPLTMFAGYTLKTFGPAIAKRIPAMAQKLYGTANREALKAVIENPKASSMILKEASGDILHGFNLMKDAFPEAYTVIGSDMANMTVKLSSMNAQTLAKGGNTTLFSDFSKMVKALDKHYKGKVPPEIDNYMDLVQETITTLSQNINLALHGGIMATDAPRIIGQAAQGGTAYGVGKPAVESLPKALADKIENSTSVKNIKKKLSGGK